MNTVRENRVRFAIFANVRTGSSSLYKFFRALGVDIVFEPFGLSRWKDPCDIPAELAKIYGEHEAIKHVYPEVTPLQNFDLIDSLIDGGRKVIYLKRKNLVLNAVSWALAETTGVWLVARYGASQGCLPRPRVG